MPGTNTIPDQIVANGQPYYEALDGADQVWVRGEMNVAPMEDLLSRLLAEQLLSVHESATGKKAGP